MSKISCLCRVSAAALACAFLRLRKRSQSGARAKAERTQSEGRAKAEWRHGVLSGVINCGVIFLGAYYSYTKKGQNKGAAFEKKKAALIGTR